MSHTSWNDIEKGLRTQPRPASQRDSQSFWAEFRARAELAGQDAPDVLHMPQRSQRRRMVFAAAATLASLIAVAHLNRQRVSPITNSTPDGRVAMLDRNEIKSLDVYAKNSGVLIMQGDQLNGANGTIVWIEGLAPVDDAATKDQP